MVKFRKSPGNMNYSAFSSGWTKLCNMYRGDRKFNFFLRGVVLQVRLSLGNSAVWIHLGHWDSMFKKYSQTGVAQTFVSFSKSYSIWRCQISLLCFFGGVFCHCKRVHLGTPSFCVCQYMIAYFQCRLVVFVSNELWVQLLLHHVSQTSFWK